MTSRYLVVPLLCVVGSCGPATSSPSATPAPKSTSSHSAAIATASAQTAPSIEPTATPQTELPPAPAAMHKVVIALKPGEAPCTLLFHGKLFKEGPEWFSLTSIANMATEKSGGCEANEFYDFEEAKKTADPEELPPGPLFAGVFRKPGQTVPDDVGDGHRGNLIEDLNFDDYADLCVVLYSGAYSYSHYCWLFEPTSRTFVRHAELDPVIFVEIDRVKKKLKSVYRTGGSGLEIDEYVWQKGKLVQVYEAKTYFQEKPDGTPLEPPNEYWIVRRELRQGKLVKTYEGPDGTKHTPR